MAACEMQLLVAAACVCSDGEKMRGDLEQAQELGGMMEERIQRGGSANRAFWNRFSARCCFKHRQAPRLSAARCIIAQPAPLRGASAPAPTAPRKGHAGQGPSRSLASRASRTPSISIGTPRYECCQLHHLVIPSCLPAHRHPEEDDPDTAASGETSSAGHEWCSAARRSRTKIQIGNKFPDSRGQRRVVIQVRLFPSGALAPRFPGLGSVTVGRPAPSLKSRVIDDAFESPKSPWFLRRAKSPGETLLFGLENIRLARDFSRFPGTRAGDRPRVSQMLNAAAGLLTLRGSLGSCHSCTKGLLRAAC